MVMNKKQRNVETYNKNAEHYFNKYKNGIIRTDDVQKGFSYLKKKNPKVLELGCAYGREAKEILKRTNDYLGIDIAENFIKMAKQQVPNGNFKVADLENFDFPNDIDIVFAFASLLHSDKKTLQNVLNKVYDKLNLGGIFYISLRRGPYHSTTRNNDFDKRTFYYYDLKILKGILGDFKIVYHEDQIIFNQKWLIIVLQK